jgi:hypothetical protein
MKLLSYSGESVVTTDAVGDAVVEYARALVAENSVDVVDIPVLEDRAESVASLVLGPMTQLLVRPARAENVALRDQPAINQLRSKLAALAPIQIKPSHASPWDLWAIDYDFL